MSAVLQAGHRGAVRLGTVRHCGRIQRLREEIKGPRVAQVGSREHSRGDASHRHANKAEKALVTVSDSRPSAGSRDRASEKSAPH